jgi:hypothetical protein
LIVLLERDDGGIGIRAVDGIEDRMADEEDEDDDERIRRS